MSAPRAQLPGTLTALHVALHEPKRQLPGCPEGMSAHGSVRDVPGLVAVKHQVPFVKAGCRGSYVAFTGPATFPLVGTSGIAGPA